MPAPEDPTKNTASVAAASDFQKKPTDDRSAPSSVQADGSPSQPSRYVVGIDLGTTNCAVGYVDSSNQPWTVETFEVAQWVDWGQFERRKTLPSFHFQLTDELQQTVASGLPWQDSAPDFVVGMLARDAGMRQPGRRIASAKSWLSHDGVDRSADLLPWHGDSDVARMSPVVASAAYLEHIRQAWDDQFPDFPLHRQDVVITLPASFDEVARELTVAAAKKAGLPRIFLIEEPQAAFYAWIDRHRDDWHQKARQGDLILVCDIGGGTSDFTLIRVRPANKNIGAESTANENTANEQHPQADSSGQGQVQFHRVAVGKHLILGGDNLDLALAKFAESLLSPDQPLPPRQWDRLIQACRGAKETMLDENRPEQFTLNIVGEGSRLIGNSQTLTLTGEQIDQVLVDGFFPQVTRDARPEMGESGFREFGLPYAHDPAITKHLASFLADHSRAGLDAGDAESATSPSLILFNGGVMASPRLRQRVVDSVTDWFDERENDPQVLEADRLDLAVAHGAAYYGMVRRGEGVRISANLARSYYMQVDETPPETMCLIPGSAEAGQTFSPAHLFKLELGTPVQFPLWVSSTRLADQAGDLVPMDRAELSPLPPIRTVLTRGKKRAQQTIDVRIETELSEIGTLGLFAVDAESGQRWRLEFDIRATLETDREAHTGSGESQGIVDNETVEQCLDAVRATFGTPDELAVHNTDPVAPGKITRQLRLAAGMDRPDWPPSLLRDVWQGLLDFHSGRKKSAAHESRWLNLVGYCLRPGYGMAVDDWRVHEVWRSVHGKLAFATPATRSESLILWRRIAGGLTAGQQQQLLAPLMSALAAKGGKLEPHEAAEMWRLAGSLEWISPEQKDTLANMAVLQLDRKQAANYRPALIWAVGRLASRAPIYGPLNTVVPPNRATELLDRLLSVTGGESETDLKLRQLAVKQIATKTGDRYRDISVDARDDVARWLETTKAAPRYIQSVREGGQLETEDESDLFGESLPLGIRLIR